MWFRRPRRNSFIDLKQKKLIAPYNSPERRHFSTILKIGGVLDGNLRAAHGPGLQYSTGETRGRAQELPETCSIPSGRGGKFLVDDENYEFLVGLDASVGEKAPPIEYFRKL